MKNFRDEASGLDPEEVHCYLKYALVPRFINIFTYSDPHAAFGSIIRKMKKCQGDLVDFRSERSTE